MRWSRRQFLSSAGLAPLSGAAVRGTTFAAPGGDVYRDLGVKPFINAAGTYTALSASLMPPEVAKAMEEASRSYVSIAELQEAAGRRIASLVGSESALVTSGCAAALTLATAACVCGENADAIRRVPDIEGLKNEVLFPKGHRFGYDHAIRNVGVRVVEAGSKAELLSAVNERTAMLFFLNLAAKDSPISREELVEFQKALQAVIAEVRRLHAQGLSADAAASQAKWGPYADWFLAEQQGPIAVRKVYEEIDGKLK